MARSSPENAAVGDACGVLEEELMRVCEVHRGACIVPKVSGDASERGT